MPSFSIIIPTFNRGNIVLRAIQSILAQTSNDWELILVDDGSTDDTLQIVSPYIEKSKIIYFFQENAGVSQARNLGVEKSTGEWLIFLDSDDELTNNALRFFDEQIQKNNSIDLFVAGRERQTNEGSETRIPKNGIASAMLAGTFCLSKSIFQKVGGYDPRFTFGENTELFHRINELTITRYFIPEISLIYYNTSSGGSKNTENIIDSTTLFLSKHHHSMSAHLRYQYHQIVAVNQLRFQRFEQAREHLWKAYFLKPINLKTFGRLVLSYFPIISKKIYKR
jgi:glycosyltransferase involved in cell wall biosynthesis